MIQTGGFAIAWGAVATVTEVRIEGYAVGLGTLALVNAGLAQSKNRRGLIWFVLSPPLGPLATFFIVLSDRLPGPSDAR